MTAYDAAGRLLRQANAPAAATVATAETMSGSSSLESIEPMSVVSSEASASAAATIPMAGSRYGDRRRDASAQPDSALMSGDYAAASSATWLPRDGSCDRRRAPHPSRAQQHHGGDHADTQRREPGLAGDVRHRRATRGDHRGRTELEDGVHGVVGDRDRPDGLGAVPDPGVEDAARGDHGDGHRRGDPAADLRCCTSSPAGSAAGGSSRARTRSRPPPASCW